MAKQTNQEKALLALLNASSIVEASEQSGLSQETLYRYLKDEDFKAEYRRLQREQFEQSASLIQQKREKAIETLEKNLTCGQPGAEIRAAQIILEQSQKGIETMDILERLERIEAIQGEGKE